VAERSLSAAVTRFAALLRAQALPVTLIQVLDGVRALDHLDITDRGELYLGLRAVFVSRPEELPIFDRCFDAFWRVGGQGESDIPGLMTPGAAADTDPITVPGGGAQKREALALDTWGDDDEGEEQGEPLGVPAVSDKESLVGQDFATFAPDQLDEVLRLTIQIARRLARRISRRRRPVRRRGRVDLRRTLRANLTRADLIDLRFRARKPKKTKLVQVQPARHSSA